MYFADFWANFYEIFYCFNCLKWVLKIPILIEQFLVNTWLQICGYEAFFVEKYDENVENWNYFS